MVVLTVVVIQVVVVVVHGNDGSEGSRSADSRGGGGGHQGSRGGCSALGCGTYFPADFLRHFTTNNKLSHTFTTEFLISRPSSFSYKQHNILHSSITSFLTP